jgi:hypothetical protein
MDLLAHWMNFATYISKLDTEIVFLGFGSVAVSVISAMLSAVTSHRFRARIEHKISVMVDGKEVEIAVGNISDESLARIKSIVESEAKKID